MVEAIKKTNGSIAFSVTSMVTGIVGLLLGVIFWLSLPLAAVAIIFGALALRKGNAKGMAIAGLVTGCVAALIGLIILVIAVVAVGSAGTTTYPTYYN